MTEEVKISMVLSKTSRHPEAVQQVQEIAESLGLRTTVAGRATISFSATREVCEQVFGQKPKAVEPAEPRSDPEDGPADFGAPGGFLLEGPLKIPEELVDTVDAISIEPPARRLLIPMTDGGTTDANEEEASEKNETDEEDQPESPAGGAET